MLNLLILYRYFYCRQHRCRKIDHCRTKISAL